MSALFSALRADEILNRFRQFWQGERHEPIVSLYHEPKYRQQGDEGKMVAEAAEVISADAASGEDEILPCFFPDFGTISTARLWGGKELPARDGGSLHIEPIIRSVAELERLPDLPVKAFEESDYQRAIRLYRRVCERLASGDIFVRTPDFQGPMNTLALLMEQTELLCALSEAPAAVHAALDRITDVLIAYVRRFLVEVGPAKVVGNIWPYLCLPGDMGVAITQDYMPLLGPEHYAEFELPRLRRIAESFGGVWIHCCGVYRQHLRTLRHADLKIWGLESSYPQMPVWEVYEIFGDSIVYLVGVSPDGQAEFPTLRDYARRIAATPAAQARFWFCSCHNWEDGAALKKLVKSLFGKR